MDNHITPVSCVESGLVEKKASSPTAKDIDWK